MGAIEPFEGLCYHSNDMSISRFQDCATSSPVGKFIISEVP